VPGVFTSRRDIVIIARSLAGAGTEPTKIFFVP